ncbi:Hypothetical protein, putative [Bodo saltans]|uniref:Protein Abitram n=1 Tax=Bodo saltans TaxID=75058 RepID=A0A0S4ILQ4_BODSA|nr:Hypothetical protein, putative [Bodo saltans]|eukprot:CUE71574.1 Hypothetical protein, putative [Bodo saltans]
MQEDGEGESTKAVVTVPPFPVLSPLPKSFTFFTERYFSQYVIRNCKGIEGNNVRLLVHSNGLCLVCLDPSHFLVKNRSSNVISGLSHSLKKDRSEPIRPQGKRKKNAVLCQRDMVICFVDVVIEAAEPQVTVDNTDGSVVSPPPVVAATKQIRVPACVDGLVLEINPYLAKQPSLLQCCPLTEGYIAIVNPHAKMRFDELERISIATSGEVALDGD